MNYFRRVSHIILVVLACLCSVEQAKAITIDKFDDEGSVVATTATPSVSKVILSSNAIGGRRSIRAQKTSGPAAVNLDTFDDPSLIDDGFLSYSQGSSVTGRGIICWDGDDVPDNFAPSKPDGLATAGVGIDLTQDSDGGPNPADSFKIVVSSFESFNNILEFTVYAYDASSPAGEKASYATINNSALPQPISPLPPFLNSPKTFLIPFSSFTKMPGKIAPVDFKNVGSIVLEINGADPATDMEIVHFSTNGECDILPVNGNAKKDLCGVCAGDNSSCKDCLGVPNGPALPGTQCQTGIPGVCVDGTFDFACDCKSTTPPTTEICDSLDNDCNGQIDNGLIDACGICGGNGLSCADCDGVPFGTAIKDACGVCKGDGSSCADCSGTPNGNAKPDLCGVCAGNNSSCMDCSGVPNGASKLDQCNVCNGDGTSCLSCSDIDISHIQAAIDHGAKLQEKIIKDLLKKLTDKDKSKATAAFAKSTSTTAHTLQIRNWVLSWLPPSTLRICGNTTLCAQVSNLDILDEYRKHNIELRDIGRKIISKLKKFKVKTTILTAKNEKQFNTNVENLNKIPTARSTGC